MFSVEKVHHYEKAAGGAVRLMKTTPYIRFKVTGEASCFLSGGQFWSQSGKRWKDADLPGWAWEQAAACTDEALKDAGCSEERMDSIRARAAGEEEPSDGVKAPTTRRLKLKPRRTN